MAAEKADQQKGQENDRKKADLTGKKLT